MRMLTFAFLLLLAAMTACGGNSAAKAQLDEIDQQYTAMYNDSIVQLNNAEANRYIESVQDFINEYPEHERSPELLFKAGETARTIRQFRMATDIYQWIYEKYPDHPKAAQSLFLRAFTLENDVKRTGEAKDLYELFLQKYPDHEFADDTEFLLKNLGKSDEEIIQSFTIRDSTEAVEQ